MRNNNIPRLPTYTECEQLAGYLAENCNYGDTKEEGMKETRPLVESAYIAVFDNYTSSSPGYVGRVMVIVWEIV